VYERFFGLADTPFRLTPDPRYLFLSKRHADALAHLKLGLTESSGFVCITGDVGTGKTTLLRHFLSTLGPEVSTAYVFNPALTSLELLQTINAEFGLPAASTSKTELLQALNAHLLAQHEQGRRAIVVVDEAQALDLEVLEQLRLLSNLETTTEKLLRIILVGQPQLRTTLQHPDLTQLNQRITLRWHIGPLGRRESAAYLNHRIDVASGEPGRRLFTRRALGLIHTYASGVPRLLNMLAHRSLLAAYAGERQRVTARSVKQAHREVSSVPLPGTPERSRRRWLSPATASFVAGAVAVAAAFVARERWWKPPTVAEQPVAAPEVASLEPEPAPALEAPAATVPAALAEGDTAEPPPLPPAMPPEDEARLAERSLVASSPSASAHAAMAELMATWNAEPLDPGEAQDPNDFGPAAKRRSLEHVVLKGNAGMLRLLDVPAVLELHFPGGAGLRYVTLLGIDDRRWVLASDGQRFTVDDEFLTDYWYGFAHLVWRDFDQLGPDNLGPGADGPAVARLQALLQLAGVYSGPVSGTFDQPTADAVLSFQRAHFLEPDGWVGPLTRLSLYATAGARDRPSLAPSPAGSVEDVS
jgi:general secretion pathway protein A